MENWPQAMGRKSGGRQEELDLVAKEVGELMKHPGLAWNQTRAGDRKPGSAALRGRGGDESGLGRVPSDDPVLQFFKCLAIFKAIDTSKFHLKSSALPQRDLSFAVPYLLWWLNLFTYCSFMSGI